MCHHTALSRAAEWKLERIQAVTLLTNSEYLNTVCSLPLKKFEETGKVNAKRSKWTISKSISLRNERLDTSQLKISGNYHMKWWIQICCQYVQMRWGERYDSDCLQPTSETCLKLCHGLKLHFNQWCSWKDDWRKALLDIDPPCSTILSGWAGDHMLCGCKAVGLGLSPTCCTLSCPLSPSLLSCLSTLSLLNKGQK